MTPQTFNRRLLTSEQRVKACSVLRQLSVSRVRCKHCHNLVAESRAADHEVRCVREKEQGEIPRSMVEHDYCGCGRIKMKRGRTCWRCELKDSPVFALLDNLIAQNVHQSRNCLELEGKIQVL